MKKIIKALQYGFLALGLTVIALMADLHQSAVAIGASNSIGPVQPVAANTVFINSICALNSSTQGTCGTFFAYEDVRWFGAQCNGNPSTNSDIGPILNSSAGTSIGSYGLAIFLPKGCEIDTNAKYHYRNMVLFGMWQPKQYLASAPAQPYLYVNGGSIAYFAGLGAENCAIDINGHQDPSFYNLNAFNNDLFSGTVTVCQGVNTNNADGTGLASFIHMQNVAIGGGGAAVGCDINTSTGMPVGNTDPLCTNVYLLQGDNIDFNQNYWGITGNASDPLITHFQGAGNACGFMFPDTAGTVSGRFSAGRIEGAGFNCFGAAPAQIIVTGDRLSVDNVQFENIAGPAYELTNSWSHFTMTGGWIHKWGQLQVTGYQSAIRFNGASAGNIDASIVGTQFIAENAYALYTLGFPGSTDNNITITGVNCDSTAYANSFFNFGGETPASLKFIGNTGCDDFVYGNPLPYAKPVTVPLVSTAYAINASAGSTFNILLVHATCTVGSPCTISNPTNAVDGKRILFRVQQSTTGGDYVTFGNAFNFGAVGAPTLSTGVSKTDEFGCEYSAFDIAGSAWNCYPIVLGF